MPTYYVKSTGSDAADGLSDATAKQTVAAAITASASGDTISLRGGDTFAESLSLTSTRIINSYGTGRATIAPASSSAHAVKFTNCGGTVENVILDGANAGTPLAGSDPDAFRPAGVEFLNTSGGTTRYQDIAVTNCDISGFITGIFAYATGTTTSGYDGVAWNNNHVHHCTAFGIMSWGVEDGVRVARYLNVSMSRNTVHHIPGYGVRTSGIGIVPGFCYGTGAGTDAATVMVQRNLVHTLGDSATNPGGGPGGIVTVFSEGTTIQWNEVYGSRKTTEGVDGVGIDFDYRCTGCVAQFNYTHDNDDCGYYTCDDDGNNTFRFNLSVGDCIAQAGHGSLLLNGPSASSNLIYNNTLVILANTGPGAALTVKASAGALIYNNIFSVNASVPSLLVMPGATVTDVQGNVYDHQGENTIIQWLGTDYASLAAFRAATGMENQGGTPRGIEADPKFRESTYPPQAWNTPATLSAFKRYRLSTASPIAGTGLNLSDLFGVTLPAKDMAGGTLPASGYSPGAYNAKAAYNVKAGSYDAQVLADAPVYYNRCDQTTAYQAAIVGARTLRLANGVAVRQAGPLVNDADTNYAVAFDGGNDYGDLNLRLAGHQKVAVEFWLKLPSDSDTGMILEAPFGNWEAAAGGMLFLVDVSTILIGYNGSGTKAVTVPRPSAGVWHHIVARFDPSLPANSEIAVHVDGVSQTLTPAFGGAVENSAGLTWSNMRASIAARGDADSFPLVMELTRLAAYGTTLPSPERILAHYEARLTTPDDEDDMLEKFELEAPVTITGTESADVLPSPAEPSKSAPSFSIFVKASDDSEGAALVELIGQISADSDEIVLASGTVTAEQTFEVSKSISRPLARYTVRATGTSEASLLSLTHCVLLV